MRLIKGKARKNIAMAEMFNVDKGNVFFDYKGVPATGGMIYSEDKFLMIDKMDSLEELVDGLNEYLIDEIEKGVKFKLFIDGNFTIGDVNTLKRIETEDVELTVSVQTEDEGISIQIV